MKNKKDIPLKKGFNGFKLGIKSDQWVITPGVFISHDDKRYVIEKDVVLEVEQVKEAYSYICLDNKSVPPNPEFFQSKMDAEWSNKYDGWFCGEHRVVGYVPPKGMSFVGLDYVGQIADFKTVCLKRD